jgi:hypothetical protein
MSLGVLLLVLGLLCLVGYVIVRELALFVLALILVVAGVLLLVFDTSSAEAAVEYVRSSWGRLAAIVWG